MLKISGDAIIEPIFLIFKNCLNAEHSLTTGKREIVSLYLKKAMSKISKTIAQSLCFQSAASFSNVLVEIHLNRNSISERQSEFTPGDPA